MILCCVTSVHIVTCREGGRGRERTQRDRRERFACEKVETSTFIYLLLCACNMAVIHGCCVMRFVCLCVCVCQGGILCVWVFYVSRLPHVEGQTKSIEAINVAWGLEGRHFLRSPYFRPLYYTHRHTQYSNISQGSKQISHWSLFTQTVVLHSSTAAHLSEDTYICLHI